MDTNREYPLYSLKIDHFEQSYWHEVSKFCNLSKRCNAALSVRSPSRSATSSNSTDSSSEVCDAMLSMEQTLNEVVKEENVEDMQMKRNSIVANETKEMDHLLNSELLFDELQMDSNIESNNIVLNASNTIDIDTANDNSTTLMTNYCNEIWQTSSEMLPSEENLKHFLNPEKANDIWLPIIDSPTSSRTSYCERNNPQKNYFQELFQLISDSYKLENPKEVENATETKPKKIEKSKEEVKPVEYSPSLVQLKKEIPCTITSRDLQTDAKKSTLQDSPKTRNWSSIKQKIRNLESDGDSPRSQSPQSYSGDDERTCAQDSIQSLEYIMNGAAAASRNKPEDKNRDQRVRRSRFVRKNPMLSDSDIRRNTLNDHSYTLNEDSLRRLRTDSTSESEGSEIDVVSFGKMGFQFKKPQNPESATQSVVPVRRPRGRPPGSTNANRKRALEDKMLPFMKRVKTEQSDKRTLHNTLERQRREKLNNLQEKLKREIPELARKPKASRASVLEEGQKWIENIVEQERELMSENNIYSTMNQMLLLRMNNLRKQCDRLRLGDKRFV
ncbi:uncharacterized protein [Linepithema humile]|uniref:uncharacterized protein isoform X2 n=1 Tax=Linepithema humile TaxID=83485 RepID=UPI000623B279|nr:PREDICTED: uncharacterized protein LOC105676895 isoform X2 [Linepithema humile]